MDDRVPPFAGFGRDQISLRETLWIGSAEDNPRALRGC